MELLNASNIKLTLLQFRSIKLTESQFELFVKLLKESNTKLTYLDLRYTELTRNQASILIKALQNNKTLTTLCLGGVNLTSQEIKLFDELIKNNNKLEIIGLSDNKNKPTEAEFKDIKNKPTEAEFKDIIKEISLFNFSDSQFKELMEVLETNRKKKDSKVKKLRKKNMLSQRLVAS